MFVKVLFLVGVSLCIAAKLGTTPEELAEKWIELSQKIENVHESGNLQLATSALEVAVRASEALHNFEYKFPEAGEAYWTGIKQIENDNAGKNITDCLKVGNEKLYELNFTLLFDAYAKIQSVEDEAAIQLKKFDIPADILINWAEYDKQVIQCTDDTAATDLESKVFDFYNTVAAQIEGLVKDAAKYVKSLPDILAAKVELDTTAYVKNYTVFLTEIKDCVAQL